MIAVLKGFCIEKSPGYLILDVNGVGYEVLITLGCYQSLSDKKDKITLFTYLAVSENSMTLFGFKSVDEKSLFLNLINVNGIGPKSALTILSGIGATELITAIQNENIDALKSISGIGKKTAERIIVELRDKFSKLSPSVSKHIISPKNEEAVLALMSLGYKRQIAEQITTKLLKENSDLNLEDLIKLSLQNI